MIKRILLALGGTPFSHVAVKRGIELAEAHGATLTAVTIIDTSTWESMFGSMMSASEFAHLAESRPWASAQSRIDRVISEFEQACSQAGIAYEVKQPEERPFDTLAMEWRYCDLVIFGLRGLFDYNLVPEPEATIARLVRQGVRPILAVSQQYRQVNRVLIAYNGSMESAMTMKRFVQLRLWPEAKLKLVCFGEDHDYAKGLLSNASKYCRAHGYDPTVEVIADSAETALLPHADEADADLIVLGDSFRHVLLRDLLGDTMSHVIRASEKPLFISH